MKKILLILSMIIVSSIVNAQFKLTIDGLINAEENSKAYTVCSFDETSKEKLFNNVLAFVTKSYVSAKDVVSKVDNEVITINAIHPQQIKAKLLKYDMKFVMVISFRDNMIKIDAPTFECTSEFDGKPYRLVIQGSNWGLGDEVTNALFNKNGKPKLEKSIIEIETFFNVISAEICRAASGIDEDEEW